MNRKRAKNLDDKAIEGIVAILDGWSSGPLTWEHLIEAIQRRTHATYTRQALFKHERVKHAFALRKKALAEGRGENVPSKASPELQVALERIARLEGETTRLKSENQRLLEQFVVWAYNASTRGLSQDFLSRPLPQVDRDQTKLTVVNGLSQISN